MLPDSTVKDPKKPKKKRKGAENASEELDGVPLKRIKKKPDASASRKKAVKKKVKKRTEVEDYGSDMELDKELHPISYYMKDRRELVRQMFLSLKKPKIKSMLPEILKKYPLEEIEELCFDQIEIMSKKRVAALIQGKRPEEISSSGTDENSSDEDDIIVTEIIHSDVEPPDSTGVTVELPNIEDEIEKVKPHSIAVAMGRGNVPVNKQRLEILELEMRARAIKKMLQSQQAGPVSDGEIEEVNPKSAEPKQSKKSNTRNIEDSKEPCASTSKAYLIEEDSSCSNDTDSDNDIVTVDNSPILTKVSTVYKRRTSHSSEIEPGELVEEEEGEVNTTAPNPSLAVDHGPCDGPAAEDATSQSPTDTCQDAEQESALQGQEEQAHGSVTVSPPVDPNQPKDSGEKVEKSNEDVREAEEENCDGSVVSEGELDSGPAEEEAASELNEDTDSGGKKKDHIVMGDGEPCAESKRCNEVEPCSQNADENTIDTPATSTDLQLHESQLSAEDTCRNELSTESKDTGSQKSPQTIPTSCDSTFSAVVYNKAHSSSSSPNHATVTGSKMDTTENSELTEHKAVEAVPVLKGLQTSCHEDIFENTDTVDQTFPNAGEEKSNENEGPFDPLSNVDDVNSALYEDVPSPGKCLGLPQVEAPQFDNQLANAEQCSTSENHEKKTPESKAITEKQTSSLNWAADLEANLDQLDEELVESEKEESKCEEPSQSTEGDATDYLKDISTDRAPTPEITAQRYRSRDLSTIVLRDMSDDTPSSKQEAQSKQRDSDIELKTKVYSSASTTQSKKSTKLSKSSKNKSKKSSKTKGKEKSTSKSEIITGVDVASKNCVSKPSVSTKDSKSIDTHMSSSKATKTVASSSSSVMKKIEDRISARKADKQERPSSSPIKHRSNQKSDSLRKSQHSHSKHTEVSNRSDNSTRTSKSNRSASPRQRTDRTRSRSPRRRRSTSPIAASRPRYSHQTDDCRDYCSNRTKYETSGNSDRKPSHSLHDDRINTNYNRYRRSSELENKHVSPKRFRAEWEPASKVITLESKSTRVLTYEQVPISKTSKRSKAITTKKRPLAVDERSKSPVRFPSPDIQVLNKKASSNKSKPLPLLVVLSDSD